MRKRFFISEDEGKPVEWLLGMVIKLDVVKGMIGLYEHDVYD